MNQPSEQLTAEYNIILADDQPLLPKQIRATLLKWIGDDAIERVVSGKRVVVVNNTILLTKAITYLGNPHPKFKKRIQIPHDWMSFTDEVNSIGFDTKFIGIYHYDGFIVFVDFEKDSYLERKVHNSSAHIYVNDLYQGATQGVFSKIDKNGNRITTISSHKFREYIQGNVDVNPSINAFERFNEEFIDGNWIEATYAIPKMHKDAWSQWKQTEWAGWFLEYKFSSFIARNNLSHIINYTALSNKGHLPEQFDFDLFFPSDNFYGDLKASDEMSKEAPGNDQGTVIACLNKHGKIWYAIYEHETIKDRDRAFEATKFRNLYVHNAEGAKGEPNLMSYHQRMKHSVRFKRMMILEINRINMHTALARFNQGRQQSGAQRNPKFLINKRNIDNFVVYRYGENQI